MALISLQEINLAFGGPRIFDGLTIQVESGERIALLGRNGCGKTTLMKVLAGEQKVDDGRVIWQKGIQSAFLPQEVPADMSGTVFENVLAGLGDRANLLNRHHQLAHRLQTEHTPELLRQLDELQSELDHTGSWDVQQQVEVAIARMKLDPDRDCRELSGGQKRRMLLARALVCKPDLLLLDEPTNHLDIDSMQWLEEFLLGFPGTVFFVTHDRMFMRRLATRIVELDRGRVFSWACDYETFLQRKQVALDIEDAAWGHFDKKLAEEEIWIRQGVKARRCRNEGRVKALERLREEKKAQRKAEGRVRMAAQEAEQSGHRVLKISNLGFWYNEKMLIRDFTTQIMRGDRIGVIGPNGSGKTTLLKLLLGKLVPSRGKVSAGTNLQIAYYDQLREQLEEERTVAQNVCGDADTIMINGKPRNIIGYLQEFLFTPDRARTPVKVLSGGERNRLFLARLFTRPSNLLVMDEPTNDLDMETLELLEELLSEYPGTLLLVSHDRAFLNNVVSSTIVLEGDGQVNEYPGGYDDWLAQRKLPEPPRLAPKVVRTPPAKKQRPDSPRKLTFKEKRELEGLPATIERLEAEQREIYARLADLDFYQKPPAQVQKARDRAEELSEEIGRAYERWEELEGV